MDPISAIGLAFGIIKLALTVIEFLKAHPAIGQEARDALAKAQHALETAHDHVEVSQGIVQRDGIEAP
jgi:GTP cyclohydrolase III